MFDPKKSAEEICDSVILLPGLVLVWESRWEFPAPWQVGNFWAAEGNKPCRLLRESSCGSSSAMHCTSGTAQWQAGKLSTPEKMLFSEYVKKIKAPPQASPKKHMRS